MLKKKKNYKFIIGLIIGIFVSIPLGYAASTYVGTAAELSYNSSSNWLTSTTVKGALDELNTQKNKNCPIGYSCVDRPNVSLGDYISYTPSLTSFKIDIRVTGNNQQEEINPSELNVWRVIHINADGSVEIISDKVSSEVVCFTGLTGYQNYVGYLNIIARQYENVGYTSGSRHFGYNSQTEYITDTSKFIFNSPWNCSTGESCNPVESQGGGDTLYQSDYNLITSVLGTVYASNVSGSLNAYHVASRKYTYALWNATSHYPDWSLIYINSDVTTNSVYYYSPTAGFVNSSSCVPVRPIVILKAGLKYSGAGTAANPKTISLS